MKMNKFKAHFAKCIIFEMERFALLQTGKPLVVFVKRITERQPSLDSHSHLSIAPEVVE